jgi:hypothetical protein
MHFRVTGDTDIKSGVGPVIDSVSGPMKMKRWFIINLSLIVIQIMVTSAAAGDQRIQILSSRHSEIEFRLPDGWKTDTYLNNKAPRLSLVPESYNPTDDSPINHKSSAIINIELSDKPAPLLRSLSTTKLAAIDTRFGKVDVLHLRFIEADHERVILRLKREIVTATLAVARPNKQLMFQYDRDFRLVVSSLEVSRE